MIGRHHVIVGGCVVALGTTAGLLPWSWPEAGLLISGLIIAGSDWPDIDHKSSSVTSSWGPVTWVLCRITRFVSRRVYVATRAQHDPKTTDPHRTFTHTWLGAMFAGVLVTLGLCLNPVVCVATGALMFTVAMRPIDPKLQWLAAALGGFIALELWPVMGTNWHWMMWWTAFTVGCITHVWSDCVTKEGAPLSWPFIFTREERPAKEVESPLARLARPKSTKIYRWHKVGPPQWMRFYTGGAVETWVVRFIVLVTLILCYLLVR